MKANRKEKSLIPLFLLAVVFRIALFSIKFIPNLLQSRIEISTVVTRFRGVLEGTFLLENGLSPYDGGVVHHAPLMLLLFQHIPENLHNLAFILGDIVLAYYLSLISVRRMTQLAITKYEPNADSSKEASISSISRYQVAALYLFNPLTIASCLGRSTIVFNNCSVAFAIYHAFKGNKLLSMLGCAMATYLTLYPIMLSLPLTMMMVSTPQNKGNRIITSLQCLFSILMWLLLLFELSYLYVGSWNFLQATYGMILQMKDLSPNIGLYWYMLIELFDHFRPLFVGSFQILIFSFAIPISLRLSKDPFYILILLCLLISIMKTYPCIGDTVLYIGFIPIISELFKDMKYSFLVMNTFIYCCFLSPIFWHIWIYHGSGNANFFYAITLVFGVAQIMIISDIFFAILKREFILIYPSAKGKEITQVPE